jgi:hypothetical protein
MHTAGTFQATSSRPGRTITGNVGSCLGLNVPKRKARERDQPAAPWSSWTASRATTPTSFPAARGSG